MAAPKWKCEKCDNLAGRLSYCSECMRTVCPECYDEFVGACRECTERLSKGQVGEGTAASSRSSENREESERSSKESPILCEKCHVPVVESSDGSWCCPKCGLVVETKIAKIFEDAGSAAEEDAERSEEDQTWEDIGSDRRTAKELPDGYDDILHQDEEDDYDSE